MYFLLQGMGVGVILAILMGPILFALIQTGLEEGFRAGAMVGLGIWVSDFLFIASVYFGVAYVESLTQWPYFELVLGLAGGFILTAFGIGTWLASSPKIPFSASDDKSINKLPTRTSSYFSLWLKGFLINTINPFTFFFWLGLMGSVIIEDNLTPKDAILYFVGIMITIITTDALKVVLAKKIRRWLNAKHILLIRRISGTALVIFGVILVIRVLF